MKNKIKKVMCGVFAAIVMAVSFGVPVFADSSISVSPLNQKIILNAGETFRGTFMVSNPATSTENLDYEITVKPFYVDDNYDIYYDNNGDYNQIVEWTTVKNPEGTLAPNNSTQIEYEIEVPEGAPAGGQYMAIVAGSKSSVNAEGALNISSNIAMAYIVYAEISGTTVRQGEIVNANVPSFVFSGDIIGSSSVKNTGNVHGTAKYTMKVYPLFSSEEVFTNEEDVTTKTVLPDRTLYNETAWTETPTFGIFNVVYTVEFEGVTTEVSKMVIVCPIWLMFIVIFAVVMLIVWIVAKKRAKR